MNGRPCVPILTVTVSLALAAAGAVAAQQATQQTQRSRVPTSSVGRTVKPMVTPNVRITGVVAWPPQHQGQPTSRSPCSQVKAFLTELKTATGLAGQKPDQEVIAIPWGTNCRYTFGIYVPEEAPPKKIDLQTTYIGNWSKPTTLVSGAVSGPPGVTLPLTVPFPGSTVRTITVDFQLAVSLLK